MKKLKIPHVLLILGVLFCVVYGYTKLYKQDSGSFIENNIKCQQAYKAKHADYDADKNTDLNKLVLGRTNIVYSPKLDTCVYISETDSLDEKNKFTVRIIQDIFTEQSIYTGATPMDAEKIKADFKNKLTEIGIPNYNSMK